MKVICMTISLALWMTLSALTVFAQPDDAGDPPIPASSESSAEETTSGSSEEETASEPSEKETTSESSEEETTLESSEEAWIPVPSESSAEGSVAAPDAETSEKVPAPSEPSEEVSPPYRYVPPDGMKVRRKTKSGILDLLHNRIEIGTRMISIELKDDSTELDEMGEGFLGTIVGLDGEDDQSPTRFFIDVLFCSYFGLELAYDKISAETKTSPLVGEVKSDGTLELSGPILSLFARYPNKTGLTPYAGVGYAFYSADFDETGHWANGYPNELSYLEAGSPNEPLAGRSRQMNVDDVTAVVFYGGILWAFHENWAVDFYMRSMEADVDANFIGSVSGVVETDKSGTFPMDHTGYGLSIHYKF